MRLRRSPCFPRRIAAHRARPRCDMVRLFRELAVVVALGAHLCAPLLERERTVAPLGSCVHARWVVRRVALVGEGVSRATVPLG